MLVPELNYKDVYRVMFNDGSYKFCKLLHISGYMIKSSYNYIKDDFNYQYQILIQVVSLLGDDIGEVYNVKLRFFNEEESRTTNIDYRIKLL